MKKRSEFRKVLLIMIFLACIFGMIFTPGCKTSDPEEMSIPVPYDIEGNTPK